MFNVFLYHLPQHFMPIVLFDIECICLLSFYVVPREIPQWLSFLLFLIMTGAVAAHLGYPNPPGLDKLRFGPARVAAPSLWEAEESNRGPFNWFWGFPHD